ncbi:MAG: hypothetical protein DWQ05_12800 [Calditrichaeota bacterium]|nr:MAG: hypothetical protein DWQ05_12800 [Calditrichota bacterium]
MAYPVNFEVCQFNNEINIVTVFYIAYLMPVCDFFSLVISAKLSRQKSTSFKDQSIDRDSYIACNIL